MTPGSNPLSSVDLDPSIQELKGGGSGGTSYRKGPAGEFGRELDKRERTGRKGKSTNVHLTWFRISQGATQSLRVRP